MHAMQHFLPKTHEILGPTPPWNNFCVCEGQCDSAFPCLHSSLYMLYCDISAFPEWIKAFCHVTRSVCRAHKTWEIRPQPWDRHEITAEIVRLMVAMRSQLKSWDSWWHHENWQVCSNTVTITLHFSKYMIILCSVDLVEHLRELNIWESLTSVFTLACLILAICYCSSMGSHVLWARQTAPVSVHTGYSPSTIKCSHQINYSVVHKQIWII